MPELRLRPGLDAWLAVVAAEMRSARRLTRTWVFVALGIAVMLGTYGYYSFLHARFSSYLMTVGYLLPRFSTAYFHSYVLWFCMAALVFLAFDVRVRDQRERVNEVLDSRPISNVALLGGRLAALLLVVMLSLLGTLVLVQTVGMVARILDWPMGDPLQPVSTILFLFVDAVPTLALWCAIVFLLAVALRNRVAVIVVALALLVAHMWSYPLVPAYLVPAVSLLHVHGNWVSDLAPRLVDSQTFLQRGSMLLIAMAFVLWAAAMHSRDDGRSRYRRLLAGVLLSALGAAGVGVVVLRCIDGVQLRETWLEAHQVARADVRPVVERIEGEVRIEPGESLGLDLQVHLRIPPGGGLEELVFSFNPGLVVDELRLDGAQPRFRHANGLLSVEQSASLPAGSKATLALRATGVPDPRFAYLDSAVDWWVEPRGNGILSLGTEAGIFETSYVALMPGLHWLPVPGTNVTVPQPHLSAMDLTVEVPDGWLVAGPGRREASGGGSRFRFRPAAPVQQVGLFAAPFERHAMEVDGVQLELLLHPAHTRSVAWFADTGELLRSRLAETLEAVAGMGIPYPYGGFSVVEVPSDLRSYGGGWSMDTVMALPGLLLLKEHGFPYARFQPLNDPNLGPGFTGGLAESKVRTLEVMFSNPNASSNALRGFARNLVTFQTAAEGRGAPALNYVGEVMIAELVRDPRTDRLGEGGIFTAHNHDIEAGFGANISQMIQGMAGSAASGGSGFLALWFPQTAAWERALESPLGDLDPTRDPKLAIRALKLRGDAVARSVVEGLGRERAAALLAELRKRHAGGRYDAGDFARAAIAAGADVEPIVGDWLNEAGLPGFLASGARVARVSDDAGGKPRYEVRVHVHNGEATPGLVRLSEAFYPGTEASDPVRIPGNSTVEIGLVTGKPPAQLWLHPYLSLNRIPVGIALPSEVGEENVQPFVGARPSSWMPLAPVGLVVDDLDPGFTVEESGDGGPPSARGASAASTVWNVEFDQGLPAYSRRPGEWSRASIPSGWGKYRHTVVGSLPGDGAAIAVFSAQLPAPGRWRLDYHLPDRQMPDLGRWSVPGAVLFGALGTFDMKLVAGGEQVPIEFDGRAVEAGWNNLGEFEIVSPQVRVTVSSRTDGEMVIADAIRWLPVE